MVARIAMALALILAVAAPALAQGMHGGGKHGRKQQEDPAKAAKKKADDAAYKSALKKIPETKAKSDPWGAMR